MNTAKAVWWTRLLQVTDRVYLALCDLEVDPKWNVNECSKLKSTPWMPLAVPGLLFNANNLLACVMIWLSKEMHFLLGFFCPELWFHMLMFVCDDVCCAWHLLCFPPLCVPVPMGCLGVCWHVINRFRKFSSLSFLLFLLGLRKLPSIAKLAEWQNWLSERDRTAAVGMESFWGPMKEEDKEIMAHGWQMVEVWLEIGLSRNILS